MIFKLKKLTESCFKLTSLLHFFLNGETKKPTSRRCRIVTRVKTTYINHDWISFTWHLCIQISRLQQVITSIIIFLNQFCRWFIERESLQWIGRYIMNRRAALLSVKPDDELPISRMQPNVKQACLWSSADRLRGANKMFIKCVPGWRDIYQGVDAPPVTNCRCKAVQRFLLGADCKATVLLVPADQ